MVKTEYDSKEGFINIWKENIIEDLKSRSLSYITVGEFLSDLKKKFGRGDNKTMKVVELKKIEKREKTIEEFVQEFRRAIKRSGYKRKSLIE